MQVARRRIDANIKLARTKNFNKTSVCSLHFGFGIASIAFSAMNLLRVDFCSVSSSTQTNLYRNSSIKRTTTTATAAAAILKC